MHEKSRIYAALISRYAVGVSENRTPMNAWLQAARPLAHANIGLPLLFGEALAFAVHRAFRWDLFAWVHIFGLCTQAFIVFSNDAADWKTDMDNRTFNRFSGGSRVVPEGKLTPRQLAVGATIALAAMALISAYLVFKQLRPLTLVACSFPPMLMWAYSYDPLRLSYRGHGEILQGIGIGIVLPIFGFYVQAATVSRFPIGALAAAFLLGYAGNIVTALPDTPSDRASGKRSYPVRRGEFEARRDALVIVAAAVLALAFALRPGLPWFTALATAVPLALLAASLRLLRRADADNHDACESFVFLAGGAIAATWLGWSVLLFFD